MFNYMSYITTWCQNKYRILFEDRTVILDKHFVERTFGKRFCLLFFRRKLSSNLEEGGYYLFYKILCAHICRR